MRIKDKKEENGSNQYFSNLQNNRHIPVLISSFALCPSMDLIALGLGNVNTSFSSVMSSNTSGINNYCKKKIIPDISFHSHHLFLNDLVGGIHVSKCVVVHRTISWQKLFTLRISDFISYENYRGNKKLYHDNSDIDEEKAPIGVTAITWSPDGRCMVLGLTTGGTLLYDIESCSDSETRQIIAYNYIPPPSSLKYSHVLRRDLLKLMKLPLKVGSASRHDENYDLCSLNLQSTSSIVTKSMSEYGKKENKINMTTITEDDDAPIQYKCKLGWKAHAVVGLLWCKLSPHHKDWSSTFGDRQDEESWRNKCHYLDRASHFLPPTNYNYKTYFSNGYGANTGDFIFANSYDDGIGKSIEGNHCMKPNCRTQISLLCVATCANGLHLYLHGKYHILSVPSPPSLSNSYTSIVCSSDLGALLLSTTTSSSLRFPQVSERNPITVSNVESIYIPSFLYIFPLMRKHRYDLQIISTAYCSIMSHLLALERGIENSASMFCNSLRQLDTKFDNLAKLLEDYDILLDDYGCKKGSTEHFSVHSNDDKKILGIANGVRAKLFDYILGGHSSYSKSTANVMDQFFTQPLMNDHLLQRLERALEANVATVEETIRKELLGPTRALLYDVGELHGLVEMRSNELGLFSCDDFDKSDFNHDNYNRRKCDGHDSMVDLDTSRSLCEATEILHIVAEQCVAQVIEIRLRLSNIMNWIRGTASHVKARGTAPDSIIRVNARERRVPEQILRSLADFLSTPLVSDENFVKMSGSKRGMTECILGVLLSDQFNKERIYARINSTYHNDISRSVQDKNNYQKQVEMPTVRGTIQKVKELVTTFFDQPHLIMSRSVRCININIMIDEGVISYDYNIKAINKRLGGCQYKSQSCFLPSNIKNDIGIVSNFRNKFWILLAHVCLNHTLKRQMIQITSIPIDNTRTNSGKYSTESQKHTHYLSNIPAYFLTSYVILPKRCSVKDIQFYGNDGNSTLTPQTLESCEEGKQSIVLLLDRSLLSDSGKYEKVVEELWMFEYDDLEYRAVPLPKELNKSILLNSFNETSDMVRNLVPRGFKGVTIASKDTRNILAKSGRTIRILTEQSSYQPFPKPISSQLIISGSRGIGGVLANSLKKLDLFDLDQEES